MTYADDELTIDTESNIPATRVASLEVEIGWDDLLLSGIPIELMTRHRDELRQQMQERHAGHVTGPWYASVIIRVHTDITNETGTSDV